MRDTENLPTSSPVPSPPPIVRPTKADKSSKSTSNSSKTSNASANQSPPLPSSNVGKVKVGCSKKSSKGSKVSLPIKSECEEEEGTTSSAFNKVTAANNGPALAWIAIPVALAVTALMGGMFYEQRRKAAAAAAPAVARGRELRRSDGTYRSATVGGVPSRHIDSTGVLVGRVSRRDGGTQRSIHGDRSLQMSNATDEEATEIRVNAIEAMFQGGGQFHPSCEKLIRAGCKFVFTSAIEDGQK